MFPESFKISTRKQDPETRFAMMPVLWGGFLLGALIYFRLPSLIMKSGRMTFSGAPSWLFPALAACALITIGYQVYLWTLVSDQWLFSRIADEKNKFYRRPRARALLSLPAEERGKQAIYEHWLQIFIIQWACGESIVLYGMALFLLSGKFSYLVGFGSVGVIDLLCFYPRKGPILAQNERWKRYRATHTV